MIRRSSAFGTGGTSVMSFPSRSRIPRKISKAMSDANSFKGSFFMLCFPVSRCRGRLRGDWQDGALIACEQLDREWSGPEESNHQREARSIQLFLTTRERGIQCSRGVKGSSKFPSLAVTPSSIRHAERLRRTLTCISKRSNIEVLASDHAGIAHYSCNTERCCSITAWCIDFLF